LKVVDNFCIDISLPEKYLAIQYKNEVICDLFDGYLWLWFSLPPGIDKNKEGTIIIDGVDNYD